MVVKIVVPGFGESITEGTVAQWIKKEGEFVKKDEILLEIESEKATQGIPSPASGALHIAAKEGERVQVGSVIGTIDESASARPSAAATSPAAASVPVTASATASAGAPSAGSATTSTATIARPADASKTSTAAGDREKLLSPAARRLALEEGVDPGKIAGSGRHGVVLKENIQEHMAAGKATLPVRAQDSAGAGNAEREKRVPMTAIRQRIAERLLTSQKATASLTTFNEVDMSAIMDLRATYKDKFKEKNGVNLGFMSFFAKAAIDALRAFPLVNATIDGRDIVYHHYYNLGVAVSTDKGLMVPVLRDAERMSFAQIEKAIGDLAVKARDGKINVTDLQGGTFTITNGGIFGSMMSTPILNFPQAAILGMHSILKRPVVRDDQIVIRPMMYLALTYDHRLIDGREAVLFLVRIKDCIEDPQRLLLEI